MRIVFAHHTRTSRGIHSQEFVTFHKCQMSPNASDLISGSFIEPTTTLSSLTRLYEPPTISHCGVPSHPLCSRLCTQSGSLSGVPSQASYDESSQKNCLQKHRQNGRCHSSMRCCRGMNPIVHAGVGYNLFSLVTLTQWRLPSPTRFHLRASFCISHSEHLWKIVRFLLAVLYPSRDPLVKSSPSGTPVISRADTSSPRRSSLSANHNRNDVERPKSQEPQGLQKPREAQRYQKPRESSKSWVQVSFP